jgi:pyridoxal phosphate enzyme (YggS family)
MNQILIKKLQKEYPNVTLILASKYLEKEALESFYQIGIHHFGENRVESYLEKKTYFNHKATWHFIGTLQTKKVKKVIQDIDVLHTIDRFKLIHEIDKYRIEPLPVFIQFNISLEPSKHGFKDSDIPELIETLKASKTLIPIGVMGMAEHTEDLNVIKAQFNTLVGLKDRLHYVFDSVINLSMGMSDDYEIALKLGSTHLRLGRILLEETC